MKWQCITLHHLESSCGLPLHWELDEVQMIQHQSLPVYSSFRWPGLDTDSCFRWAQPAAWHPGHLIVGLDPQQIHAYSAQAAAALHPLLMTS